MDVGVDALSGNSSRECRPTLCLDIEWSSAGFQVVAFRIAESEHPDSCRGRVSHERPNGRPLTTAGVALKTNGKGKMKVLSRFVFSSVFR